MYAYLLRSLYDICFLIQKIFFTLLISTRFQNAQGALLYPIYGQGELSQAFCRRAAVKGCLYVSSIERILTSFPQ